MRKARLTRRTASPSLHVSLRPLGSVLVTARDGPPSLSQDFSAAITLHSARQILRARWASRRLMLSSIVWRHSEIVGIVTSDGGNRPNTGPIYFQPRSQSSRVRGAFFSHSFVPR